MPLKNTSTHFGTISRFFHWSVFLLILYQMIGANIMTRLGREGSLLGMDANFFYNWHKSVGLVILGLAVARLLWRKLAPLPEWHDSLTPVEKTLSHRLEIWLYWLMFALPITGYLFVMAGGYGIKLFGVYDLPNPIGKQPSWSWVVWSLHILFAYCAVIVISWHVGHVIKKHKLEKTGLMNRMLPFRR